MYDHSYSVNALKGVLRKRDFHSVRGQTAANVNAYRKGLLDRASKSAETDFGGKNPIDLFHLKKKSTYRIQDLGDDLVIRKLSKNLSEYIGTSNWGRDFVISNLQLHLEEGVPYRLYRLDIKSFYESFSQEEILARITALQGLSPISKRHLRTLLSYFSALGGTGIPRGMAISAVLADLMMRNFDLQASRNPFVYFYGRYVDDIVVLTNTTEKPDEFLKQLIRGLPTGLRLNSSKQQMITIPEEVKTVDKQISPNCVVEYLGYRFTVFDPLKKKATRRPIYRDVHVDIADQKLKRVKTRIARSFLDFSKSRDFQLLHERIKFLTSNFSVQDRNSGRKRLAGIHHSYPQLTPEAKTLDGLDQYLRAAVLSKTGRVFGLSALHLSNQQKRQLLRYSFRRGHTEQILSHFSGQKISAIQKCWDYE